jgi:hypothetical protein
VLERVEDKAAVLGVWTRALCLSFATP